MSTSRTLVISFLFAAALSGQTSTGEIDVVILDPSDAVIPNAEVKITGAQTGNLLRTLHSNSTGAAVATLLPPETYDLTVGAQGFSSIVRKGISVHVGEAVTLRIKLQPGSSSQSVTVTGETPLVEEKSTTLADVTSEKQIIQLPLNGRDYLQLANLVPGSIPNSTSRDNSFSAYGNSGLQNAFLLDGARNVSYLRGLDTQTRDALRPPLDSIAEFTVQLSNYSAEFGASAGGIVNVVTKNGTNVLHGSAYDFLRNDNLDASNFFAAAGTRPLLVQNQYGGSIGAPIKKDRAWIFAAFEGTPIRSETANVSTVPSPAMLHGNFGNTPIYDPLTTVANPSGSGSVRQLFPDSAIPASRLSSIGQQIAEWYPAPNLPGAAANFAQNTPQEQRRYNSVARGDVQVTSKDSMFARITIGRYNTSTSPALPPPAQDPVVLSEPSYGVGYGYTRVFSPTRISEFRFAWSRLTLDQDGTLARNEIIPGLLDPAVDSGTPVFNITGYASIGAQAGTNNIPLRKSSGDWDIAENLSWTAGNHLVKFGADFQLIRPTTFTSLNGRGTLGFTGVFTQNPQQRSGTGSPFADLLLGDANSAASGTIGDFVERGKYLGPFVQDQWSVTSRFTITLGLRYELICPYTETHNQLANFILNRTDPLFGQLVISGNSAKPKSLLTLDENNFAPRVGFAYNVPHVNGLIIRASYGIFYAQDTGLGVIARLTGNPPFYGYGSISITSDQLNPATGFVLTPGASVPRPAPINPSAFVLVPTSTANLVSWSERNTIPYTQEWNFDIQKQLPAGFLAEISYVGNHGVAFWGATQGNQPLVNGPGSPTTRRPLAQYTVASIQALSPWDQSSYEGLSGKLERRFSSGVSLLSSFTWGKVINLQDIGINVGGTSADTVQNSYNLRGQRGPADDDVAFRFVVTGVWDLPFGTGHSMLGAGWKGRLAGPWQLTAIYSAQTGLPYTMTLSFDNANAGTASWPNRICNGSFSNPTIHHWFDTSCFVAPPPYVFGNAGKNILFGPGMNNLDLGLHRVFVLPTEHKTTLEFRAEAFNALNHPQFANPASVIGSPSAGIISATSQINRQMQLAARWEF